MKAVFSGAVAALIGCATAGQSQTFPEGPGQRIVTEVCGGCHAIDRLRAGYSPEGWHTVLRMMQNIEAPVPEDQWPVIEQYLAENFPEKPRPAAVLIPGPTEVSIKMWPVPTPGSRPHDPLAGSDGSIWYSGQMANVLGRLDPATGVVKEYPLKTPRSGPHGLVEAQDGAIWFTANGAGYIGRLDPSTGQVAEYPLPDPAARDPHSLVFDQAGMLWFTVQRANMVGRLDPARGEVKLATSPTPRSRPYGIQVDSKGVPFFVEFGANKIGRIDPQTMAITEYELPDEASRPRRLAFGPDDAIWYADFSRGRLGRLDPKSGAVREWPSPSGSASEPYGIVFVKGAVWYSESKAKPNTLVRFDPGTEKFQSWAIPGGGEIVRNMDVSRTGNPVLANSLVNAVGLVEITR